MDDQVLSDNIFVARSLIITANDPDLASKCGGAKPRRHHFDFMVY